MCGMAARAGAVCRVGVLGAEALEGYACSSCTPPLWISGISLSSPGDSLRSRVIPCFCSQCAVEEEAGWGGDVEGCIAQDGWCQGGVALQPCELCLEVWVQCSEGGVESLPEWEGRGASTGKQWQQALLRCCCSDPEMHSDVVQCAG